jgi:hypothetical protein
MYGLLLFFVQGGTSAMVRAWKFFPSGITPHNLKKKKKKRIPKSILQSRHAKFI